MTVVVTCSGVVTVPGAVVTCGDNVLSEVMGTDVGTLGPSPWTIPLLTGSARCLPATVAMPPVVLSLHPCRADLAIPLQHRGLSIPLMMLQDRQSSVLSRT